jgi:hypothetical protein
VRAPLRAIRLTLIVLTAVVLASCAGPSPTAPTSKTPPFPTITGLTITGLPAPLILGESVQLTAKVTLPSGVHGQTSEVTWQSSDRNVATISSSGLLTGTGLGDADVTASFLTVRETAHVAVRPPVPVGRLDVTIDKRGSSLALVGATEITFDMSQSIGFGLRYDLAFGDGSTSSGEPVAKHVYNGAGCCGWKEYTAEATVTDVLGRTHTVSHIVQVISLSGDLGYWSGSGSHGSHSLKFYRPDGGQVRGVYSNGIGGPYLQFTGTVSAAGDIHLVVGDGTMTLDGWPVLNDLRSASSHSFNRHLFLTIRGGTSDGTMVDFWYGQPY